MALNPRMDVLLRSLPGHIKSTSDAGVLEAFATDESGRRGKTPRALVSPNSADDVQRIIKWATKNSLTLVPVSSSSGPRRRGDTVSSHASVIVDLSVMQRIIHVDGRDAVAIIEPGVTFQVLNLALQPHGLRSYQPLAPRASKSVISAFLEREPMTVPGKHWDVADPLASMEFVFGTGDVFRTGGAAMPGTLEENLAHGNRQLIASGPSLTDFGRVVQGAQGALAIVTWASILCQRIPAVDLPLFASADSLEPIVELCYSMLRRRPAGQMFILNNVQLALLLADDASGYAALKAALPNWILFLELSATSYFPEEAIAYQQADLDRDAAGMGVKISTELAGQPAARLPQRQRAFADVSGHQRAGFVCQEVFSLSQLDAAPSQAEAIGSLGHTGDVAVYLQPMVQGVSAHCQFTLLGKPGQEASLSRSAVLAAEKLADNRGFLSRPYHPWAHVPFSRDAGIQPMLALTKELFDPGNILQPEAMSLGGAK